jgi:hypothetical protein
VNVPVWLAATALAAGFAAADAPPPSVSIRKGTVVAVDGQAGTLTLRASAGNQVYTVVGNARGQLAGIQAGDYVEAQIDPSHNVFRFVKITKKSKTAEGKAGTASAPVNLVVLADAACRLFVNVVEVGATKAAPGSPRDHKAELALAPGVYILRAVTADGREWEGEIKPGRDVQTVRIAFAPPPPTLAEFDTAAAQAWLALRDARTVGRAVGTALEGNFAFYDFDMSLVYAAQEAVKRTAAGLRAASDPARRQALPELKRAASEADKYLAHLGEAMKTAIAENRSGKGSPARAILAQARALEGVLAPEASAMTAVVASAAFLDVLPPDRLPEVGGPRDAQDLDLGADYCHVKPATLAVVDRDGLADKQLKLEAGDAVVSADGKPLASLWDLKLALRAAAGRKLKLAIERKGRPKEIEVRVPAALP